MSWPPSIADALPEPEEDYPPNLRQDIADELADHLDCAVTRELHLVRDAELARQNALDRFGDPRKIARKLWFDALQEKIMSQRLMWAALVVVLVIGLGSTGLTWLLIRQTIGIHEELLAESRAARELLLARLDAQESREPAFAASPEWNPFKVKLQAADGSGQGVAGFTVELSGHILDVAKPLTVSRVSDAAGLADFGLIRPGEHNLNVISPWGEWQRLVVTVLPGAPLVTVVVCPTAERERTEIQLSADWPDDLKGKGLWLVCKFVQESRVVAGKLWSNGSVVARERIILLSPEGEVIPFALNDELLREASSGFVTSWPFSPWLITTAHKVIDLRGVQIWPATGLPEGRLDTDERTQRPGDRKSIVFVFAEAAALPMLEWSAGDLRLDSILVGQTPESIDWSNIFQKHLIPGRGPIPLTGESSRPLQALSVIAGLASQIEYSGRSEHREIILDWDLFARGGGPEAHQVAAARLRLQPKFTATAGAVNHWTFPIPDPLLERVQANPEFMEKDPPNSAATSNADAAEAEHAAEKSPGG